MGLCTSRTIYGRMYFQDYLWAYVLPGLFINVCPSRPIFRRMYFQDFTASPNVSALRPPGHHTVRVRACVALHVSRPHGILLFLSSPVQLSAYVFVHMSMARRQ